MMAQITITVESQNTPLENPDLALFVDGSYVKNVERKYQVVDDIIQYDTGKGAPFPL